MLAEDGEKTERSRVLSVVAAPPGRSSPGTKAAAPAPAVVPPARVWPAARVWAAPAGTVSRTRARAAPVARNCDMKRGRLYAKASGADRRYRPPRNAVTSSWRPDRKSVV